MANLFHTIPGLNFTATDMDTIRLTEELNTALSRYCGPIIDTFSGLNVSSRTLGYILLKENFYQRLAIEFYFLDVDLPKKNAMYCYK